MSLRKTREDRPILTGAGKTPPAIKRSSVRFEMDNFCAARGRVKRSHSSFAAGAGWFERTDIDVAIEELIEMKDSVFRTFACAVTTVAACNAKPS